ncbi:MAG TPA: hypothetical protein VL201_05335 [Patescibacteria group bacterium]|jgi:hypothetical protein|nr:hypothetical protein [Patescibacteria group bacterium]
MEEDSLAFTVSPAILSLNPDRLLYHPSIEKLTIYKKYAFITQNEFSYDNYFKITNNLKVIQLFCQSRKTLDEFISSNPDKYIESRQLADFGIFDKEKLQKKIDAKTRETEATFFEPLLNDEVIFLAVLLPDSIQYEILKWCSIFPEKLYNPVEDQYNNDPLAFSFRGFLNEECAHSLLHKTFHLPDFDVTCNNHKDKFFFDVTLKDPSKPFDCSHIIARLKKAGIIPDEIKLDDHNWQNLLETDPNNMTIPLTRSQECLGRPFIITPFFPQKERFHHSGRFGGQYQTMAHFYNCNIEFQWYVRSYYYLDINPQTKIFIVELMDETVECAGDLGGEYHPWNAPLPKNHHIKILQYDTVTNTHKEIQTIILSVARYKPDDDHISKPFSNARFKIITIIHNILVLYDAENDVFPCFANTEGDRKISYLENTANNKIKNIELKKKRSDAKKEKVEEKQLKREKEDQERKEWYKKYIEEERKKSFEKIKKYVIYSLFLIPFSWFLIKCSKNKGFIPLSESKCL